MTASSRINKTKGEKGETMNPIAVNKEKCIGCGKIPKDSAEKATAVKDSVTRERTIDASRA